MSDDRCPENPLGHSYAAHLSALWVSPKKRRYSVNLRVACDHCGKCISGVKCSSGGLKPSDTEGWKYEMSPTYWEKVAPKATVRLGTYTYRLGTYTYKGAS